MPHIACQILDQVPAREVQYSKQAISTIKRSVEYQRPATAAQSRRLPLDSEMPNLSLLVTSPDNSHWEFGSIRHIRKASENITPVSAIDSLFELPSAGPYQDTPNSSTHSLFVAELEDTSPHPFASHHISSELAPKSPAASTKSSPSSSHLHSRPRISIPNAPAEVQSKQPQTPTRSVRSSKSRSYLHPSSPAAVSTAGLRFDPPKTSSRSVRSSRSHSDPQSTFGISVTSTEDHQVPPVPRKPSARLHPAVNIKSRAAAVMESIIAIEDDNRQLLERAIAAEKKAKALQEMNLALQNRVGHCDQHHRPKTAPTRNRRAASEGTPVSAFNTTPTRRRPPPLTLTPDMKAISRDYDLAARGSPVRPARRAEQQAYGEASGITGPVHGSVVRQQLTYKGTPISHAPPVATISLAEARRREKPLPFIMPISPSIVPGYVEMGSRTEICAEERRELRKKKTFGDLFRWGKRPGAVKG